MTRISTKVIKVLKAFPGVQMLAEIRLSCFRSVRVFISGVGARGLGVRNDVCVTASRAPKTTNVKI